MPPGAQAKEEGVYCWLYSIYKHSLRVRIALARHRERAYLVLRAEWRIWAPRSCISVKERRQLIIRVFVDRDTSGESFAEAR